MISRISGNLESIDPERGRVLVSCGPLAYEVLVPAADLEGLEAELGREIAFHTHHYLEAQGQGSAFVPRLIGFRNESDRAFFTLFTTVKGVGNRKALRALTIPCGTVAAAIAERDVRTLTSLPEIGKRTADTIVAELHGKVDRFIELKMATGVTQVPPASAAGRDAVAMLVQLGEQAAEARRLVDRVLAADPTLDAPDAIVAAAYRVRGAV